MIRILKPTVLVLFGILVAGAAPSETVKAQAIITYNSMKNDIAAIEMNLLDNGKFRLEINFTEGKKHRLKGKWSKQNGYYQLMFKKTSLPIEKLFDMNDPNKCHMNGQDHLEFEVALSSLWIWGIQCEKDII